MAINESKLNEFLGRALVDLGGAVNAVTLPRTRPQRRRLAEIANQQAV